MEMNKIPMTLNGYEKIQSDIQKLKNVDRPEVVAAIAAALVYGDLSENAEYHAAKEKQGMIEARLADLEDKLSRAEVVDASKIIAKDVKFGATITIEDEETGVRQKFQIVGSDEADIKNGLLPVTSPLARNLIGKKVSDIVEVNTPKGMKIYTLVGLEYI